MTKDHYARPAMLRGLLLDCAIWFSCTALFLYVYVSRFGVPDTAIVPHLRYVGLLLCAVWIVRAALCWAISHPILRRAATTLVVSAALILLLLYYFLVIVGLNSWNRVVSWELVAGYLPHMVELAATLEIALWKAFLVMVAVLVPVLAGVWFYLRKFDWILLGVQASPGRMLGIYLAAGCVLLGVQLFYFLTFPDARRFEPFAMTAFPEMTVANLALNDVDKLRAAALDQREDQVRAAYKPNPGANKRNVITIVVDALRMDHMGIYGYERDTTPYLSQLEKEGRLRKVTDLRAACAETTCGLLSLYSSKFVTQFSSRPITVQEVLRSHGYAIKIVLGGDHTNFYGMTKIYREVDSFFDGSMAVGYYPNDDKFVTEKAEALPAWDARPILLQYHLMSAHTLGKRNKGTGHFTPAKNYIGSPSIYSPALGTVAEVTRNHYDNGVVQADNTIKQLLATLKGKGYLENAIVVITADHGEALGEHGLFTHANSLHEPLLRVPFMVISYGASPPELPQGLSNASLVDIAPTILAQLDMPAPASWSGVALNKDTVNPYTLFDQAYSHGLLDQTDPRHTWKYWIDVRTHTEFAFDIRTDPQETRNLIASVDPARKIAWRRKLLSNSR